MPATKRQRRSYEIEWDRGPGLIDRSIRYDIVGDGSDAHIRGVHHITARTDGRYEFVAAALSPTIKYGLKGMCFVDACGRSSKRDGAWVKLAP